MRPIFPAPRSLTLAAACVLALHVAPARAQSCNGAISSDVGTVSVTSGGVQNLTLSVLASESQSKWHMIGSFSGTAPGLPMFADGGLFLNEDRYMHLLYTGYSPLVQGGLPNAYGMLVPFDVNGNATLQVVVPPGAFTQLVGRTVHHGFYRDHHLTLLPTCGSNTVALTFAP